jgi:integrase/recombinase XerC
MATISMGSAPIITRYARHLRACGASPETIRTARSVLHGLAIACGSRDLLTLTPRDLTTWQETRAETTAPTTLRKDTSYAQCFFRWAVLEECLPVDPAAGLPTPRVPKLLPRPMDEDLFAAALDAADDQLRAVIALAGFGGLRAAEIAGLDWRDVTLTGVEPWLRVVGKGSKERIIDLSPDLVHILARLSTRRGPVIRRRDGKSGRVSPNALSKVANRHLRACDIPDPLHSLRHRFGTVTCRLGGLRVAQEALGHASPTSTAGYAQVARREIRPVIVAAGRIQAS